jgi:hypothetical protein
MDLENSENVPPFPGQSLGALAAQGRNTASHAAHPAIAIVATTRPLAVGKAAVVPPGGQLRGRLIVIDNSDVVGDRFAVAESDGKLGEVLNSGWIGRWRGKDSQLGAEKGNGEGSDGETHFGGQRVGFVELRLRV